MSEQPHSVETVGAYLGSDEIEQLPDRERVVVQTLLGLAHDVPVESYWEAEPRFQSIGHLYEAFQGKNLDDALTGLEAQTTNKGVEVIHKSTGIKATGNNHWQARENLKRTFETKFQGLHKRGATPDDLAKAAQELFAAIEHDLYGSGG